MQEKLENIFCFHFYQRIRTKILQSTWLYCSFEKEIEKSEQQKGLSDNYQPESRYVILIFNIYLFQKYFYYYLLLDVFCFD